MSNPLAAQEIFNKKEGGSAPNYYGGQLQTQPQEAAPVQPQQQTPSTAAPLANQSKPQTQRAVSNDLANQYYKNCITKEHPVLSRESQEMLCACTAAKMITEMGLEEIQAMFTATDEGVYARDKMLMRVYAPCMEYPTRDLVRSQCLSNQALNAYQSRKGPLCKCVADNIGSYMAEKGPGIISNSLRRNPGNVDPLGAFLESRTFEVQSGYFLEKCLHKHVFGHD